jgi:LssY C-terminus
MRDSLTAPIRFYVWSPLSGPVKGTWFPKRTFLLALACIFCASGYAQDHNCSVVPAGQQFWIRLTEPVSSYSSKQGATVQAILTESPRCGGLAIFSAGTAVQGRIKRVRKVGMGFRHESSALGMDFNEVLAGSTSLAVNARVEEVANGREAVKAGVIEGVGGRATPQRLMSTRLLHLPFWNSEAYWIFLVQRGAFPFSPEPEIYLPPGTDLRLRLMSPLELPTDFLRARQEESAETTQDDVGIDEDVREKLLFVPSRSVTRSGRPSDVVNLVFIGSPEQIGAAFEAAGWTYGDSVSTWSVLREMRAFSSLNSYSHLPISRQWLGGEAPDIRLQKSFNSYQKREHIRIWNEDALEQELWVGGAIRETSATWSIRTGRFIHHVDADVDAEREKVVRDLTLTGCVANVSRLARPERPEQEKNASGDALLTDGSLAVVELKDCEAPAMEAIRSGPTLAWRPRSKLSRLVRAQALSIHDLWRSNVIYVSVDLGLTILHSLRNRRGRKYEGRENVAVTPRLSSVGAN